MEDTKSIIEFYLNKHWEEIPENIRKQALDFIKERKGIFEQVDGLAVIKRKQNSSSLSAGASPSILLRINELCRELVYLLNSKPNKR